jgi:hypothetical protein
VKSDTPTAQPSFQPRTMAQVLPHLWMLRSRTLRPGNIITMSLARNHQVPKPRWPLLKRHNASQGRVELSRGKSMAQFTTPRKMRRASYSIDGTRDVLHQRNNSAESLPSVHGKAKVEHHHNTAHQYAMQIEHDKLNNNQSVSNKKIVRTISNTCCLIIHAPNNLH